MIAGQLRKLKPGTRYNRLITPSDGIYTVRRDEADTTDTLKLIQAVIRKTLSQTAKLAPVLQGSTLQQTCKNIWYFVYEHIQYHIDRPGHEEIRHPSRTWADRVTGVDCDDYTVMISSILSNLRIPHKLRITDYGKGWQHIYVVVPKNGKASAALDQTSRSAYIAIDCVPDQYDFEVPYTKHQDIAMTLNELSGVPVGHMGQPAEMGNIFKKIGGALKKVAQGAKKVVTTPVRLGILAWMRLNVKKAASKLRFGYLPYGPAAQKAGYGPKNHAQIVNSLKKLIHTFMSLGGDHAVLRRTIINGAGNKDHAVDAAEAEKADPQEGFHGFGAVPLNGDEEAVNQISSINSRVVGVSGLDGLAGGQGLGELGIVAEAAIAAAAAIIVPILNMLGKAKENDPTDPIPGMDDDGSGDDAATDDTTQAATTDDVNGIYGLGATAKKKKAAATRVKTAVAKQAAKGKKVTPAHKKAVAKATKITGKTTPVLATSVKALPTTLPGVSEDGTLPESVTSQATVVPTTTVKKSKKAKAPKKAKASGGGLLKKAGAAIKSVVSKVGKGGVKKKVQANAKKAKAARAKGDHATAKQLDEENAVLVKTAASQVDLDPTVTNANTGVYVPTTTDDDDDDADVPAAVQKVSHVVKKATKAVNAGAMTVEEGRKIVDRASSAIKTATGKKPVLAPTANPSAKPSTQPASSDDSDSDDGYDSYEILDENGKVVQDSAKSTLPANPTPDGEPLSTGAMIGLGIGALLLGKMFFGGSSAPRVTYKKVAATASQQSATLNGVRRRKRKSTSAKPKKSRRRSKALGGFAALSLQD